MVSPLNICLIIRLKIIGNENIFWGSNILKEKKCSANQLEKQPKFHLRMRCESSRIGNIQSNYLAVREDQRCNPLERYIMLKPLIFLFRYVNNKY